MSDDLEGPLLFGGLGGSSLARREGGVGRLSEKETLEVGGVGLDMLILDVAISDVRIYWFMI